MYNFFAWFNAPFDSGNRVLYYDVCWHVVIYANTDGIFACIVLLSKISAILQQYYEESCGFM